MSGKLWSFKRPLPKDGQSLRCFNRFFMAFVIGCPSTHKEGGGRSKRPATYSPVSRRGTTFRAREIRGSLLTTLLRQIKGPLERNGVYEKLPASDASVEETFDRKVRESSLSDERFDAIVFCARGDMSDIEALYYYIRNAFAHGSVNVESGRHGRVYYFESAQKGVTKCRMRLKEETLERFASLAECTKQGVIEMRKGRGKR